jgi:hypothetical protein
MFNLHEKFASESFEKKYIEDNTSTFLTSIDINNMYNDIFTDKNVFEKVIIVDPNSNCVVRFNLKGELLDLNLKNLINLQLKILNSVSNVQINKNYYNTDVIINLNRIYFILYEISLYKIYKDGTLDINVYDQISSIKKSLRDSLNIIIVDQAYRSYIDINLLTVLHNLFYIDTKKLLNDNKINIYALAAISNSFVDSLLFKDSFDSCNLKILNNCLDDLMNTFNFTNINTINLLKEKLSSKVELKDNIDVTQSLNKIDQIISNYNKLDKSKIVFALDNSVNYFLIDK